MESPKVSAINVDVCGTYDFITIASEEDNEDCYEWPVSGEKMTIDLRVSHDGPNYDDIEYIFDGAPNSFQNTFEGLDVKYLFDMDQLPIASGEYELEVEFEYDEWTDWESGWRESDYGWSVLSCKRIGNLSLDSF